MQTYENSTSLDDSFIIGFFCKKEKNTLCRDKYTEKNNNVHYWNISFQ